MNTFGEVTAAGRLIMAEVTAVAVFTPRLLNQVLAVVVTINVMQATPSILSSSGR